MKEPTTNPLRVIYLEDKARDRELVAAALAAEGLACEIIDARNREEFEAALVQRNIDLILCDFTLPSYGGTEALAAARKLLPETPFIFVSGTIGEERAVESLRSGATDYVLKDHLERLAPVVRRALHEAVERHFRKGAEQRIGELNLLLRAIRDINRLIARERDPERFLAGACHSLVQTRGYLAAWVGLTAPGSKSVATAAHAGKGADCLATATVTWDEAPAGQGPTGTAIRTGKPWVCQNTATDPRFEPWREAALTYGFASIAAVPMIRDERAIGAVTVYSERVEAFHVEELGLLCELAGDLAYALENIEHERRNKGLEEQLRQAQKMEAIGHLAGGVAHDFNNLLAVMRGNAELLLAEPEQHSEASNDSLRQIVIATERAANLTRQLLAFGRKQVMQAQPCSLNEVIVNLAKMIKRIIGEDIHLHYDYAPDPVFILGDVGMLEQVLVNLVVNARDAILHDGKVGLATERVSLDADYVRAHPEARAGEFVRLSVSDNGTGIAPDSLPHIFEPFFTTKAAGKGTGLGLSIVYGIIKQHQGWIEVTSQPGAGARFDILLPAIPAPVPAAGAPDPKGRPPGGTELILLVEDDIGVREMTQRLLETFGYRVWKAGSAQQALDIWRAHASEVNLLLTDIVMPGTLTCRELAERLCHENPQLKVIFMSGYNADVAGGKTDLVQRMEGCFLQKPCASRTILETVRRCLDDNAPVKPRQE
jgi:two-component system, cell cycle sensor histidine kinase and response regulator CckA